MARVKKRQSVASYMGETAKLGLERGSGNTEGRMINASIAPTNPNYVYTLERETEISVSKDSAEQEGYYRVMVLSWFVDATAFKGGQKVVDYDANLVLAPGQTALFKLMSDYEIKRSGRARSYMAVTMRSVSPVRLASVKRGSLSR
ncbi:MAG: hypothetical protein ICV60_23055 [Pyrinomonadaceae bacterium]|nr:hypothetical protein [Pyrinomonadaceae bacterium]